MKRNIVTIALCLLFLFLRPALSFAQKTDCSADYEKAFMLYNVGLADSALRVINQCVQNQDAINGVSKDVRARIYRLAALSSIMTGKPDDAEKYARKMLTYQPDYKNTQHEGDLAEFQLMLDKISPQPSLILGIAGGINIPFLKIQKHFSNYELQSGEYTVNGTMGYQFGIMAEKAITRNFSLEAGAGINRIIFDYSISGIDISDFTNTQYLFNQNITSVEIPVLAKYYFNLKSFRPYLEAGINGRFLLNSMEKSDTYGRYWFTESSNSDNILTSFLLDYENFGILAGGGACYDFDKFSLRLDIRYSYYLNNSNASSGFDNVNGYDDISPDEKFHYTDDINLLNMKCLQVSFGFLYNMSYRVF
jgi:hypothetical protein